MLCSIIQNGTSILAIIMSGVSNRNAAGGVKEVLSLAMASVHFWHHVELAYDNNVIIPYACVQTHTL